MRSWIVSCTFLAIAAFTSSLHAQPAALDARWADLSSPDEAKAMRAALALAATPKETLAFLKDHLKPVKADPKRVAQLMKSLDSNTFLVRHQASMELEYYGKYIQKDLEAALKGDIRPETKTRIEQLLEKLPKEPKKAEPPMPLKAQPGKSISISNINGQIQIMIDGQPIDFAKMATPPTPPPGPPQAWIRASRAVTLLEHLGTPEAQAILQALASGESDALPTVAAREALERMKK